MLYGCCSFTRWVGQVAISTTRDAAAAPSGTRCITLLIRRRQAAVRTLLTRTGIIRKNLAVLLNGIGLCIQPRDLDGSFRGEACAKSEGFLKGKGTRALCKRIWSKGNKGCR